MKAVVYDAILSHINLRDATRRVPPDFISALPFSFICAYSPCKRRRRRSADPITTHDELVIQRQGDGSQAEKHSGTRDPKISRDRKSRSHRPHPCAYSTHKDPSLCYVPVHLPHVGSVIPWTDCFVNTTSLERSWAVTQSPAEVWTAAAIWRVCAVASRR